MKGGGGVVGVVAAWGLVICLQDMCMRLCGENDIVWRKVTGSSAQQITG